MTANKTIDAKALEAIRVIVHAVIPDSEKVQLISQISNSTNSIQNFVAIVLQIADTLSLQSHEEKETANLTTRQKKEDQNTQIQIDKLRETLKQLGQF